MTQGELAERGYKPFYDFKGIKPIHGSFFFSSMGLLAVYYVKGNISVRWSLNYIYPKDGHNPPCMETIINIRTGACKEVVWDRICRMRELDRLKKCA